MPAITSMATLDVTDSPPIKGPSASPVVWIASILWITAVMLIGGVFTSYHQPMRVPADSIFSLVSTPEGHPSRMLHVLSGSCACSQRVMAHLVGRKPSEAAYEQILVVDGAEPYLPGSKDLLRELAGSGFEVTHVRSTGLTDLPSQAGLRGVPLLVVATPDGVVRYKGGYGMNGDQDAAIFTEVRAGRVPHERPVLGCAVGAALRRKADPFRLKYQIP